MRDFIPAASASILTNNYRSFEALIINAHEAIMTAVKQTQSQAAIPYDGVTEETHRQFHSFLLSKGYVGGGKMTIGNGQFYRIKW